MTATMKNTPEAQTAIQNAAIASQRPSAITALSMLGERYNIERGKVADILRATVMKTGSEAELIAFAIVANQYNLNPFTREIYAFPSERGIVPIIPIDGWARIVNSRDDFDGCEFKSDFADDGKLFSITCTMHVKNRSHPIVVTEYLSECFRKTKPWEGMPSRMLRHKAFMQAARLAFSLTGLFDEDEAHDVIDVPHTVVEPEPQRKSQQRLPATITNDRTAAAREVIDDSASQIADDIHDAKTIANGAGFDAQSRRNAQSKVPEQPADNPTPVPEKYDPANRTADVRPISEPQAKRFIALASRSGRMPDASKFLKDTYNIDAIADITRDIYEEVCVWAQMPVQQ